MAIRAVLFDFGGVLVQTINQSGREKWEKRLGLPSHGLARAVFDSQIAMQATLGQVNEEEIWKSLGSLYKLSAENLSQMRSDFWSGDWLDTNLINFLLSLRPHYKTAILSNAWLGAREMFVNKYHLDQIMDLIVISSEVSLAKPDPRIYQLTVDRLGARPEEIIFVDDVLENVRASRQVGLIGLQYRSTPQLLSEIRGLLDHQSFQSDLSREELR
jgi:epoxide hydrolase-like predicted phosphatase